VFPEHAVAFGAAHRAALTGGKPLIYLSPPAGWVAAPLFRELRPRSAGGCRLIIIVPGLDYGLDLCRNLRPIPDLQPLHVLTGLSRSERLLRAGSITTLVGTPNDVLQLVSRAALPSDAVEYLAIAWPEQLNGNSAVQLDGILAEVRGAQRLILTSQPDQVTELLTRYAHRAPTLSVSRPTVPSTDPARFAVVSETTRVTAVRAALDILNPANAVIWDPTGGEEYRDLTASGEVALLESPPFEHADLVVAADLPTIELYTQLAGAAATRVILIRASQLRYLQTVVETLRPIRLPGEVDRAREATFLVRSQLRDQLKEGGLDREMLALEPLLDEYDPALIAAALLASREVPVADVQPATWTRIHVNAGRKDEIKAGDLVGALINSVGVRPSDVGRIELRPSFSIVEIRPETADTVIRGLTGTTIRGRRVTARLDRS